MQGPQLDELINDLQNTIDSSPYTKSYKLSVCVSETVVTLSGTVRTFFHKQMAQVIVQKKIKSCRTCRLFTVNNEIEVG